jgi:hypothetical protein
MQKLCGHGFKAQHISPQYDSGKHKMEKNSAQYINNHIINDLRLISRPSVGTARKKSQGPTFAMRAAYLKLGVQGQPVLFYISRK